MALTADMHSNIGQLKQKISASGVPLTSYYNYVDLESKGYISSRCLQNILNENSIFCDETDVKCLMKLFRKKVDERILANEFMAFIDL